jgi:PEP-CTERM motif
MDAAALPSAEIIHMPRVQIASFAVAGAALLSLAVPAHAAVYVNDQAAFDAAAATTLAEDFEATGQPLDTQIYAGFTHNGISWLGLAGVPAPHVWIASAGYNNFGAGVGVTTSKVLTANGDEHFVASFATPVSAFGFDAYFNGLGPTTLKVFNGATQIDGIATPGTLDFKGHIGVAGVGAITSFSWVTAAGGSLNTGLDNLTTAPVPEPAAVWLMALGLAAIAVRSRAQR